MNEEKLSVLLTYQEIETLIASLEISIDVVRKNGKQLNQQGIIQLNSLKEYLEEEVLKI